MYETDSTRTNSDGSTTEEELSEETEKMNFISGSKGTITQ